MGFPTGKLGPNPKKRSLGPILKYTPSKLELFLQYQLLNCACNSKKLTDASVQLQGNFWPPKHYLTPSNILAT